MKVTALKLGLMSAAAALLATAVSAQDMSAFRTGPVFEDFGPHAPVEGVETFATDTEFAHSFDVAEPAKDGGRNRGFESAARFINMHVAHGVAEENIRVAVVVHGKAVHDLLSAEGWAAHDLEGENGSAAMVRAMLDHGVRFIVCGQSAAAYGVTKDELTEGVEMDLSAMTAHAKLQQRGYTVNPF
ncbi:DsrE family protein [Qipengyuania gelatinilytica]|uniref:DsrE family protein n=1 Tax=Qipengyuania gelatinilytica TaxID=2867231 RepID=A0ABX9A2P3_9SPHN|nr:DsrE family protein [Qipengyuania gelatinilytica]QZD94454.1 DsrE family protein [Qipengyuania gelatinilytica]